MTLYSRLHLPIFLLAPITSSLFLSATKTHQKAQNHQHNCCPAKQPSERTPSTPTSTTHYLCYSQNPTTTHHRHYQTTYKTQQHTTHYNLKYRSNNPREVKIGVRGDSNARMMHWRTRSVSEEEKPRKGYWLRLESKRDLSLSNFDDVSSDKERR